MQNTTNQQQTFYTRPGMTTPTPEMSTQQPKLVSKKVKQKKLFAIAGLVLFFIVAIMGVLIAQRQITPFGEDVTPVAPTAPESRPSASTFEPNNCVVTFNVPSPSANCDAKTALTDFSSNGGINIPAGSPFNVGDEFVFSLTIVQPSGGTLQNVKVLDTLPTSLSFVSGPANAPYTVTNNGQVVTATIPEMGSNSTVKVEFKVRVTASNYGDNTNTASVEASEDEQSAGQFCSYNFVTLEGITECVDKTLYNLQGRLIANGGALTRGQQYEYRVTAKTTNRSLGEVKIHDILPEELEYVRPATGSEKYITNDPVSGILTANLGILEDEEATVGFIVKVPDDLEPTDFTNTALVYAYPVNSREQEPPATADKCEVTHTILPVGTAECVEKEALTDFGGTKIASGSEVAPGSEFIYKVTVAAKQTTSGPVTVVDELHRDLTFIQDSGNTPGLNYNASTREVSIDLGIIQTNQTKSVEFKVQLAANPQNDVFNNVATVFTDGDTKHTCELPLKVEKSYSCNSECTTNAQCLDGGNNHICYNTGNGNFCRLASNPSNESCSEASPTPTPPPTGPATPTPAPTPAPGCNETCSQNADCTNINHICLTTADGTNRCRLASYPDSTTCTEPVTTVTTTTTAQQPVLPTELPQSGPGNWLNWLKAGLVTLGIGTALFLLL